VDEDDLALVTMSVYDGLCASRRTSFLENGISGIICLRDE
jgi:hypothetical protein